MILVYAVLIGISAYRGWRMLALDTISEPFRDWLYGGGAFREFLADLILCPWCLGWWYCCIGAWVVADLQDYNPAEFGMVALGASTICGATHHALERLSK